MINRLDFASVEIVHGELAAHAVEDKDEKNQKDSDASSLVETSMRMKLSGHITHALNDVHIVGTVLKDAVQKKRLELIPAEESMESTTIDVPHQYAFQRKSLAKVLEKFRTGAHQVTQANESSSDYIQQLSLLAKQWRVRWSGPAPICEFDFRSAGSTFHNRGEAEVVEKVSSKTGALMLTIDVPRRLQTLVEVSCKIEHQPDYTSALKPTLSGRLETSQGFSWEHLLTQTQESLFAQELFVTLTQGVKSIPSARASVTTDQLKFTVGKHLTLHLMLDAVGKVGSETKCSGANVTQDSKGTKDPQERLVPLAAKMLLRNQHRDNNSGHHSEVKRGYNGTTQRHEPLVLLRETMSIHFRRETVRTVGRVLHDVAREVAFQTPRLRVFPHLHTTGTYDQPGFTVHVHTCTHAGQISARYESPSTNIVSLCILLCCSLFPVLCSPVKRARLRVHARQRSRPSTCYPTVLSLWKEGMIRLCYFYHCISEILQSSY